MVSIYYSAVGKLVGAFTVLYLYSKAHFCRIEVEMYLSVEYLPGPNMKIAAYMPIYIKGNSIVFIFISGKVKNAAIVIEKINGSTAKRVNNPNISKTEQPASQRIIIIRDHLLPNPIGSGNVDSNEEKFIILSIPCVSIIKPTNKRKNRAAKSVHLSQDRKPEICLQLFILYILVCIYK